MLQPTHSGGVRWDELDLLGPEDLDPLEERLGEHLAARALGFVPERREVSEICRRFLCWATSLRMVRSDLFTS